MTSQQPLPEFEAGDDFLHAVLGLLAACERLEGMERRVEGRLSTSRSRVEPAGDDPLLHAMLGLIVLRERLGSVIEAWAAPGIAGPSEPHPRAAWPKDGLLR